MAAPASIGVSAPVRARLVLGVGVGVVDGAGAGVLGSGVGSVDGAGVVGSSVGTVHLSSPGFCVGLFRPLSFVLLCVCFLLVAV